jgi:hypothetical protein
MIKNKIAINQSIIEPKPANFLVCRSVVIIFNSTNILCTERKLTPTIITGNMDDLQ